MADLRFSPYRFMSSDLQWQFYLFLSNWILFISFYYLIVWLGLLILYWVKVVNVGILVLFLICPFLSSPSHTPIMWMLVCLLSWKSLKPTTFKKFFYLFCSASVISTTLSFSSLIHSSVSSNQLLIPSSVILILVIKFVFFSCLVLLYIF